MKSGKLLRRFKATSKSIVCAYFLPLRKKAVPLPPIENEKFYFMTKPLKIVVLAKQVPDTRNVGKEVKP
ncbi:MAG: hypothetical protein Q4F82_06630 [bacterium]|nr:hypothetical protein [bacterium]